MNKETHVSVIRKIYIPSGDYIKLTFNDDGIMYDLYNIDDELIDAYGHESYEDLHLKLIK